MVIKSMEISTITIQLEGADMEQTERCRKIIHKLFEVGFFNIKRGKGIVSFDHVGDMGAFSTDIKNWDRSDDKRAKAVDKLLESVTVVSR